jgi:hypothetical protein
MVQGETLGSAEQRLAGFAQDILPTLGDYIPR